MLTVAEVVRAQKIRGFELRPSHHGLLKGDQPVGRGGEMIEKLSSVDVLKCSAPALSRVQQARGGVVVQVAAAENGPAQRILDTRLQVAASVSETERSFGLVEEAVHRQATKNAIEGGRVSTRGGGELVRGLRSVRKQISQPEARRYVHQLRAEISVHQPRDEIACSRCDSHASTLNAHREIINHHAHRFRAGASLL